MKHFFQTDNHKNKFLKVIEQFFFPEIEKKKRILILYILWDKKLVQKSKRKLTSIF